MSHFIKHSCFCFHKTVHKDTLCISIISCREYILVWYFHLFVCWVITWLSLIDRPCVGVKEEPAEEESWYCSKCMGRSKKPAKRGRGRGRGRGPGRGKKKMIWTPLSQTEASARKEKIIVWNFVSENRGKMEKEKCCELSTQRTRLNKGKKQIYVNYCVRERGSARGRETNIM